MGINKSFSHTATQKMNSL